MQLSLRQLQQVLAVAQLGSFSRAAEELHLSQPALSRSIAAMEERFAVRLFERTRSAVVPTAVGLALVEHGERLMLQARALEHNLGLWSSGEGGSVAFGMGPTAASILMPRLLALLATDYPSLRINARTNSALTLRAELGRDEIEFLICNRALLPLRGDVETERLGTIQLGLFARAAHPLAGTANVARTDVAAFPLARGSIPGGHVGLAASALITDTPAIECDNYHILREVMLSSDAIWISSSRLLAREIADGRAVRIDCPAFGAPNSEIDMVWLADRALSPAARMIATRLKQMLDEAA